MEFDTYFDYRQVDPASFDRYVLPEYLVKAIGPSKTPHILDFGCGFGQLSLALHKAGYEVEGLDISPPAIAHCRSVGLTCHDGRDESFIPSHEGLYDLVVMSHVVEHFPKDKIIPLLSRIKTLLKPDGGVIVMVPNAQSNTGAYWAYEDFTHYTMFTSGSLYYVLRAAGFKEVVFLDPDCLEGSAWHKKIFRKILLKLYRANYIFWNKVTGSSTHIASPLIFSYEVKALGKR
jgi:SAM-dependent methyltransferase